MEELDYRPYINGFSYFHEKSDLVFFNHEKFLRLSGQSAADIIIIAPYLSGFNTIERIASLTKLPEDYVVKIVKSLMEANIVKINSINDRDVLDEELKRYENFYLYSHDYKEQFIEDTKNFIGKNIFLDGNKELVKMLTLKLRKYFNVSLSHPEKSDLIVGLDFIESEALFKRLNDNSLEYNTPFLRTSLVNNNAYIGPIFLGEDSSCYDCFITRLDSNTNKAAEFNKIKRNHKYTHEKNEIKLIPGSSGIFVNLIYLFIIRFFSKFDQSNIVNREYHLNLNNMDSKFNHVLRLPSCKCVKGETNDN